MNNVGVFEMAERREKRAGEQQDMLARCGLPLVCINMNIAGPVKRGALIDWAFFRALNAAANSFKGKIRGFAFTNEKTGIEAMLAVDAAAESLKKQAERTAYEEYAQNKRLSAQDARTRLVAESSSSAKTVTISQAVASYEANFTMAVSVSNKTQ